jgi:hypothetical protein
MFITFPTRATGGAYHTASALPYTHKVYKWCLFLRAFQPKSNKNKLRGLSPRANYTDRTTAVCRRTYYQLLRIESATWFKMKPPETRLQDIAELLQSKPAFQNWESDCDMRPTSLLLRYQCVTDRVRLMPHLELLTRSLEAKLCCLIKQHAMTSSTHS